MTQQALNPIVRNILQTARGYYSFPWDQTASLVIGAGTGTGTAQHNGTTYSLHSATTAPPQAAPGSVALDPIQRLIFQTADGYYSLDWDDTAAVSFSAGAGLGTALHGGHAYAICSGVIPPQKAPDGPAPALGVALTFQGAAGALPTGQSALTPVTHGTDTTVDGAGNLLLATTKSNTLFEALGPIDFPYDLTITLAPGSPVEFPIYLGSDADATTFYQVFPSAKAGRVYFGFITGGHYTGLSDFPYIFGTGDTSVGIRVQDTSVTLLRNGAVVPSTAQKVSGPAPFGYIGLGTPAQASALSKITVDPVAASGLLASAPRVVPTGAAQPVLVSPDGGVWSGKAVLAPSLAGVSWDLVEQTGVEGTTAPLLFKAVLSTQGVFSLVFTSEDGALAPSPPAQVTAIAAKPPGALTSSAGYTISQRSCGAVWDVRASYLALTPMAAGWPADPTFALTIDIESTEGCFGNVVNATRFGNTLTPIDKSKPITLVALAAQPGTMVIVVRNNGGLVDPDALVFSVANLALEPPPLSDLVVCMPYPVPPGGDYAPVGWVERVGGIGPDRLVISSDGYTQVDDGLVIDFWDHDRQPDVFTLTLTDGRGDSVQQVVQSIKGTTAGALTFNVRNPQTDAGTDIYEPNWAMRSLGGVTNPDGSALNQGLQYVYDAIRWTGPQPPRPGRYPIRATRGDFTLATDVVIVPRTDPAWLEFKPKVLSTATIPGAVLGRLLATVPLNAYKIVIDEPSGVLEATSDGLVSVKAQPKTVGLLPFQVTLTTGRQSIVFEKTIPVVEGVTLDASAMDFSGLTTKFLNDTTGNVIGTPKVSGIPGTPVWTLVTQTDLCLASVQTGEPAPFQTDPATGLTTHPKLMSAGCGYLDVASKTIVRPDYTYTLVWSVSDGIHTCTASQDITVSWAQISKTIHVGKGQSTKGYAALAAPTVGYETWTEARLDYKQAHAGLWDVVIHANPDRDYYAGDNGLRTSDYGARFPSAGPIQVRFAPSDDGTTQMPRAGGLDANTVAGGGDMRGKGFFVAGEGDCVFWGHEISCTHDAYSDGSHGIECIRKDGQTAGNLSIIGCHFHDGDNGIESGFGHSRILVEHSLIENGGTSHVSSGACHNAYIGQQTSLIVRFCVSRHCNLGHLLKARAQGGEITDCVLYDGDGGSASACINLPNGGKWLVARNYIEKGPNAFGPGVIRWIDEGAAHRDNHLTVVDNVISVLTLPGGHFGAPAVLDLTFAGKNAIGEPSIVEVRRNKVFLAHGASRIQRPLDPSAVTIIDDATWVELTAPSYLPTTRPDTGGPMPPYAPLYRQQYQDDYRDFAGVQQILTSSTVQTVFDPSAPAQTVVLAGHGTNDLGAQGAGTANPFGPGTKWAIAFDPEYNGSAAAWPPDGRYVAVDRPDGGFEVHTAGPFVPTEAFDTVQLRGTAPGGATTLSRHSVIFGEHAP